MRRRGLTIFWPQYFDKKRPVRLGRRLVLESATEKPSLQDVSQAAQKLKYHSVIDKSIKYPRSTWDEPGALMIDTMGQKKTFVLHKLAPEVKAAKNRRLDKAKLEKVKKKHKKKEQTKDLLKQKLKERQAQKKKVKK